MRNRITAVVVTYNRLNCLQRVIKCLKDQTIRINEIIVVNNGSTDGSKEWLNLQDGIIVIHQDNVGGSGGFYRGIKEAIKSDNEWIWCMDDDVYPRKNCLETLLKYQSNNIGILCPQRIQNGKIFISEYRKLNLSNPFLPLHQSILKEEDFSSNNPVEIMGMVFEGPLIRRKVIEKIGLPMKDYFILYDDTDYSYRTICAGFKVLYIPEAIIDKELFRQNLTHEQFIRKNRWKEWYHIRNTTYFCKCHGKNFFYRIFGGLFLTIYMFSAILINLPRNNKYEKTDLLKVFNAYIRGRRGLLGKM